MSVDVCEIYPFSLEMKRPFVTAKGVFTHRDGAIVGIRDSSGQVGFGEASPLPGFSEETLEEVCVTLGKLKEETPFGGISFDDLQSISSWMTDFDASASVRNAVEQAMVDLLAKRRGVPLCRLLNPEAVLQVPTGCLVTQDVVSDELLRSFSVFKMKIGQCSVVDEIQRVRDLACQLPAGALIRLDANRAFDFDDAVVLLESCSGMPIEYCEEPLNEESFERGAQLRERVDIPIALDESLVPAEVFTRALEEGLMDVVILKQMMVGGPLEALRRAEAAAAHHLGVCFTTSLESRVGRLGVAHVAASFRSSFQVAGGLNTGQLFRRDLGDDLEIAGGVVSLGGEPGLGPVQLEVAS